MPWAPGISDPRLDVATAFGRPATESHDAGVGDSVARGAGVVAAVIPAHPLLKIESRGAWQFGSILVSAGERDLHRHGEEEGAAAETARGLSVYSGGQAPGIGV